MAYFDIKRDNQLIFTGKFFWCNSCLVARPISEQSPDNRYCQSCFETLKEEAKLLHQKKPSWIPNPSIKPKQKGTIMSKKGVTMPPPMIIDSGKNVTDNLRHCKVCGAVLNGKRIDQVYCGVKCRVLAHRNNQTVVAVTS
jgi:hypothetical protein